MNNTTAIIELLENQKKLLAEMGMLVNKNLMPFSLNENSPGMNVLKKIGEAHASLHSAIEIVKEEKEEYE